MSLDVEIVFKTDKTCKDIAELLRDIGLKIKKEGGSYSGHLVGVDIYVSKHKDWGNIRLSSHAGFHFDFSSWSCAHSFFNSLVAEIICLKFQTKVEVFYDSQNTPAIVWELNPKYAERSSDMFVYPVICTTRKEES